MHRVNYPLQTDGASSQKALLEVDEGTGRLFVQRCEENRLELVSNLDAVATTVYRVSDQTQILPAKG